MKSIRLIGAPVDTGSPYAGCAGGPAALRAAGLAQALADQGHAVSDVGDVMPLAEQAVSHPNKAIRSLSSSAAWVQSLHQTALCLPDINSVDVFMGGDHLMAAGTIPPIALRAQQQGKPLFCLWLDAHTDFHSLNSTDTGNLHGTPAAYVCGQDGFSGAFPTLPASLDPARLCMLGIRSVDDAELQWLKPLQTRLIDMNELDRDGVHAAIEPFLAAVRAADGLLHLSFDVDCLDPTVAPGVGTAVEGGVRLDQARALMTCLADSQLISSVDIAELNPTIDASGQTARVMVELMSRLFAAPADVALNTGTKASTKPDLCEA